MFNRCKSCDTIISNNMVYCNCCAYIEQEDMATVEEQIDELELEEELLLDEGQIRKASRIRKQIEEIKVQNHIDTDELEEN